MIDGVGPLFQALLGTLFTWGLTAAGSALVFIFHSGQRKILDGSLGFAAGVMIAASYWSLLAPAIELAENSGIYGTQGQYAFIPVALGCLLGAVFVYIADVMMSYLGVASLNIAIALQSEPKIDKDGNTADHSTFNNISSAASNQRRKQISLTSIEANNKIYIDHSEKPTYTGKQMQNSWKRICLLIVAITIHNIPEGLAVGVGFGAIGKSPSSTFENARNLAIGIGIQNFPEGLAVSLPLRGAGLSTWRSFWYGQLSGMVEPIAGIFGALAVVIAEPILPYALAFAAGAMIYVVVDDIIPEAQMCGNGKLASWCAIVGFVVMMSLDVGLG